MRSVEMTEQHVIPIDRGSAQACTMSGRDAHPLQSDLAKALVGTGVLVGLLHALGLAGIRRSDLGGHGLLAEQSRTS